MYGIGDCIESCWEVEFVKILCVKYLMACVVEREHVFLMLERPSPVVFVVVVGNIREILVPNEISYKRKKTKKKEIDGTITLLIHKPLAQSPLLYLHLGSNKMNNVELNMLKKTTTKLG